ncbi:hypothetical protein B0T26DRAFT_802652 [Lasiosphaeria miniovina]|uniref:Uncharacterized protein n=1 Tax=Lasiosphaeria miniovina TaxID=1954250 RepID=A0AA40AKP6_9PEZI|nr:uncharacterized protein B0T26DRAFT_802652 [Lasiosphaeria miniovina]KAK0717552.1 hypothetical protein B0T26DRAFT_802652 [Lasiosphaeria miniovina]
MSDASDHNGFENELSFRGGRTSIRRNKEKDMIAHIPHRIRYDGIPSIRPIPEFSDQIRHLAIHPTILNESSGDLRRSFAAFDNLKTTYLTSPNQEVHHYEVEGTITKWKAQMMQKMICPRRKLIFELSTRSNNFAQQIAQTSRPNSRPEVLAGSGRPPPAEDDGCVWELNNVGLVRVIYVPLYVIAAYEGNGDMMQQRINGLDKTLELHA